MKKINGFLTTLMDSLRFGGSLKGMMDSYRTGGFLKDLIVTKRIGGSFDGFLKNRRFSEGSDDSLCYPEALPEYQLVHNFSVTTIHLSNK